MNKEMPVSVWPDWKIVEKIGEGSFGKVYKAEQIRDGKTCYSAIKIVTIPGNQSERDSIRAEVRDEKEVRAYFRALVDECTEEVMMMLRLRGNSNIVSVEDCKVVEYLDDIGWDIFIRMEYLTGFTEYYSENPLTEEAVIRLGIDMCRALEHCQQINIIHRDIKPENIFVSENGEYKLGDFGIARQLERTTSSLSKKGTFSYMAPEMYRGKTYDSRVDVYSLGIVLYKLRNHNRLPFLNLKKQLITYRDKENALTRRMSGEDLPVPIDAGDELARIILKACAFYMEERYASAAEMRVELEALLKKENAALEEPVPEVVSEEITAREELIKEEAVKEKVVKEELPKKETSENLKPVREKEEKKRNKENKGNKENKEKKSGRSGWNILMAVGIGIAAIACGLIFHNLRQDFDFLAEEEVVYDKQELMTTLNRIQERANVISEQLNGYNWIERPDERIQYFDSSWQLMKVLVYPEASDEGVYEEYFYWYGKCFFAYIWVDDKIDYYYYNKNGELIRWIDSSDACHDYETKNTEYVERGKRYWEKSMEEVEKVQNGVSY